MSFDGKPEMDWRRNQSDHQGIPRWRYPTGILEPLRARMDLGLFTLFVKIKTHRREFFNEMADRWADKGRHTEMEARWTSLRRRPIFTWTASGVAHRSIMSKVVTMGTPAINAEASQSRRRPVPQAILFLEGASASESDFS